MVDPEDEDTIEIQLTPTQLEGLLKAAELALVPVVSVPAPPPPGRRRSLAVGRYLAIAGAAVLVALSVATAYQLGTRSRIVPAPTPTLPALPARDRPPASGAKLPMVAPPQPIPVRFANPFDAGEIFEFPEGTSESAAREAVAELLIRRAQERQTKQAAAESLARRS